MIVPIQTFGSRPPLFVVPGLYGVVPEIDMRIWDQGPDQPVYFTSSHGLDGRRLPCNTVTEMAAAFAEEIRAVRPSGPYLLGGFCPGSVVALEIARHLRARGNVVGRLLVLDPAAGPRKSAAGLRQLEASLSRPAVVAQLHDKAQGVLHTMRHSRYLGFDPKNPAAFDHAAKTIAGVEIALARHSPDPYDGAVSLVLSDENAATFFDPANPWQEVLTGPRETHVFKSGHMALFIQYAVRIGRLIRRHLEMAIDELAVAAPVQPDARQESK